MQQLAEPKWYEARNANIAMMNQAEGLSYTTTSGGQSASYLAGALR